MISRKFLQALVVVMITLLIPFLSAGSDKDIRDTLDPMVRELLPALESVDKAVVLMPFSSTGQGEDSGLERTIMTALVSLLESHGISVRDSGAFEKLMDEAALADIFGGRQDSFPDLQELGSSGILLFGQTGVLDNVLTIHLKAIEAASGKILQTVHGKMTIKKDAQSRRSREAVLTTHDTLVVALRRLADDLARGVRESYDEEIRYVRAAVVDFEEAGSRARHSGLGRVVAAEVATVLRRDHGLILVERSRLRSIMDEHSLSLAGIVDPAAAAEVGSLLGADLLIFGSVSEFGDSYRVNVRAVGTDDAQVVSVAQTALPAADLIALSADAVVLRSRSGAVFRSVLIPGWGQFYNRQAGKGAIILGVEGVIISSALGFHLFGQINERDYRAAQDSENAGSLRVLAESRYQMRNYLVLAAGAAWALNVVDAWAYGRPASADWSGTGIVVLPSPTTPGLAVSGVW